MATDKQKHWNSYGHMSGYNVPHYIGGPNYCR